MGAAAAGETPADTNNVTMNSIDDTTNAVVSEDAGGAESILGASNEENNTLLTNELDSNNLILGDTENSHSFTELNTIFQEATPDIDGYYHINLNNDYKYDETADSSLQNGISITHGNIIIDGNGYTIDGNNIAKNILLFPDDVSNVTIKNITFKNSNGGSAIAYKNLDHSLINATFIHCIGGGYGAAIGRSDTNAWRHTLSNSVIDGVFINNTGFYCTIYATAMYNMTFRGYYAENNPSYGIIGAYYDTNNVTYECTFYNNTAECIYMRGASTHNDTFINCTFENNNYPNNNKQSISGLIPLWGTITNLEINSTFKNNTIVGPLVVFGNGGTAENVTINSNFEDNTALPINGNNQGLININKDDAINVVISSNFENNTASYVVDNYNNVSNIDYKDSTFEGNTVDSIIIDQVPFSVDIPSLIRWGDNIIFNVTSSISRDVIYSLWNRTDNTRIDDNSITIHLNEGVQSIDTGKILELGEFKLKVWGPEIKTENVTYKQSTVEKDFSIYHAINTITCEYEEYVSVDSNVKINVSAFLNANVDYKIIDRDNNIIKEGIIENGNGTIDVIFASSGDYTILLNSSGTEYIFPDKLNKTVHVHDKTFKDLKDDLSGGAGIYKLEGYYIAEDNTIDGIPLVSNMVIDGQGKTIIDANDLVRIFVASSAITNLTIKNVILRNAYHTGAGSSQFGGAIRFSNTVTDSEINATFENNKHYASGSSYGAGAGAIAFMNKVINVNISGEFKNNTAHREYSNGAFGGAIYFASTVDNLILNATFINNTVLKTNNVGGYAGSGYGGAVYFTNTLSNSVINSTFINNGALANTQKNPILYGGALYFGNNLNNVNITSIFDSNFITNKADINGIAIYAKSDNVNISGSVFKGHNSDSYVVYIVGDNFVADNVIFTDENGGNIKIEGNNALINNTSFNNCIGESIVIVGDTAVVKNIVADGGSGNVVNIAGEDSTALSISSNRAENPIIITGTCLKLNITIDDVNYPDQPEAVVYSSVDGNYILTVDDKDYTVIISNGEGRIVIDKLDAEKYSASIRSSQEGFTTTNTTEFTVNNATIKSLNVTVADVDYLVNAIAVVNASTDGQYIVVVNDKNYTVNVVDGTGNVTLDVLPVNSYPVTVISNITNYVGDNSTSFIVNNGTIIVTVELQEPVTWDENASLIITTGVNGSYTVTVNGIDYIVSVVNGVNGSVVLNKLPAGMYNVTVTGTIENYNPVNEINITEFEVLKINTDL